MSQSAFGTIHSALTGPAPSLLTRRATSPVASTCLVCSAARMSIHRMQGMSGSPASSRATTVQHVVSQQIPATSDATTPVSASTLRTEDPMPAHQSFGSCSAHPGRGYVVS